VQYLSCSDEEALTTFDLVARTEGILPALETSHAIAKAIELAKELSSEQLVVVCLSGRGDKDAAEIQRLRSENGTN
jgi:tryptophan synthase beta chain